MDAVDPRTRHKVSLNPTIIGHKSTVLSGVLLSDALLVLTLHAGKTYLLSADLGVFWVLVRVLACGAIGFLIWVASTGQLRKKRTYEWSVIGMSALLLFLRQAGLITALYRLPSTRVVIVTHFSVTWFKALAAPTSLLRACSIITALCVAFFSDSGFSTERIREILPAYGALALEAIASGALDHTQSVLIPSLGEPMTNTVSTLGAFLFSVPLYLLRHVMTDTPSQQSVSLAAIAVIPLLGYVQLFLAPRTARAVKSPSFPAPSFLLSYLFAVFVSITLGLVVFGRYPSIMDFVVASLLLYGTYPRVSDPAFPSPYASSSRVVRAYLKSILSNPESRKIFYFLMLNMCYMLVQMLYGVWTNSLGLISDAIHMAFDCMAIGVGLIASVMARWPPNERFTYGYSRIETLSGFANGIFLILISLFIVFEAIQRLLEPPEMNTSQLLLVSSLGLGVNLFGMFAMGGHHHHGGHSHSHGHSHAHDDHHEIENSPLPSEPRQDTHSSSYSHSASSHSHTYAQDEDCGAHTHAEDHSHSQSHTDAHSHSHSIASDVHSHPHSPSLPSISHSPPYDSHTHAHDDGHAHSDPLHSHSHSPDAHSHSHTSAPRPSHTRKATSEFLVTAPRHVFDDSPLTPNYKFGHDAHYETHHHDEHGSAPNLHDHAHVHERAQHEGHSHNMRGVFLHVMADTLGSVGVIVSTLLIQWYGWTGFDPIASLFIAILIAASVIPLVIDTGKVLALDLSDRESEVQQTLSELSSIQGLASYNSPRFWPKDDSSVIGSIHIQLAPSAASHDPAGPHSSRHTTYANVDRVVERVDKLLRSRISGLEELTIQVEESALSYR